MMPFIGVKGIVTLDLLSNGKYRVDIGLIFHGLGEDEK